MILDESREMIMPCLKDIRCKFQFSQGGCYLGNTGITVQHVNFTMSGQFCKERVVHLTPEPLIESRFLVTNFMCRGGKFYPSQNLLPVFSRLIIPARELFRTMENNEIFEWLNVIKDCLELYISVGFGIICTLLQLYGIVIYQKILV